MKNHLCEINIALLIRKLVKSIWTHLERKKKTSTLQHVNTSKMSMINSTTNMRKTSSAILFNSALSSVTTSSNNQFTNDSSINESYRKKQCHAATGHNTMSENKLPNLNSCIVSSIIIHAHLSLSLSYTHKSK